MARWTFSSSGLYRDRGAATSLAAGIGLACLATLVRSLIDPLLGAVTPYAFVFLAVAIATVVGGRWSGIGAVVTGQGLAFALFVYPEATPANWAAHVVGLSSATIAQLVIVLSLSAYFASLAKLAQAERSRRELSEIALKELDHRTKNNFQLAVSILQLHGSRNANPEVKAELDAAATRLLSLEAAYANLAVASGDIRTLALRPYCDHLVAGLGKGLLADGVTLTADVPDIAIDRDTAITIGMAINELVTNSAKHAFPDGHGSIVISGDVVGATLHLACVDDGIGGAAPRDGSVGSRLVERLIERMGGTVTRLPGDGTGVLLTVPV